MEPWRLTALELVEQYKACEVSPVEAVEGCLKRLNDVNPILNAVVTIDADAAQRAAEESAKRYAEGVPLSSLDGVPFTVKDNLYVANMRATWGSEAFVAFTPDKDDLPIARLRAAGGIVLGKTNTPELALAGHTNNTVFGSTGNPWAPHLSPGGSSGGAASALVAGVAPIAFSTDAGGSTRRPACHCGCVGLRTSIGAIPRRYGFPPLAHDFQTVGLMARTVGDIRVALKIVSNEERAPIQMPRRPIKIAAVCDIGGHPVDPEIRDAFSDFVSAIRECGVEVTQTAAPFDPNQSGRLLLTLASAGIARIMKDLGEKALKLSDPIASLGTQGKEMGAEEYARTLDEITAVRWAMSDFFKQWDLLITPTAAALPWPREESAPKTIDGQKAGPRASAIYTTFGNVAGLPGINVPFAVSQEGLPIGMQILGPIGADRLLLDLAEQLERDVIFPTF